jgi:hypothetical protein
MNEGLPEEIEAVLGVLLQLALRDPAPEECGSPIIIPVPSSQSDARDVVGGALKSLQLDLTYDVIGRGDPVRNALIARQLGDQPLEGKELDHGAP